MPLFMLLCGYFFGSSLKLTFRGTVEKEVRAVALALGDGFCHSVDGGVRHGA